MFSGLLRVSLPVRIFVLMLSILLFAEGLGVSSELIYLLVLKISLIFFLVHALSAPSLTIPRTISIMFAVFLGLAAISTFQAPNIHLAFEYLIYLLVIFLVFSFSFHHRKELRHPLIRLIVFSGIAFALYSLFLKYMLPLSWYSLRPDHMFQYVFDPYHSHHPLGTFLVLPAALLLPFAIFKRSWYLFLFLFFFLFIIWSYSRASYVTIAGIVMLYALLLIWKKQSNIPKKTFTLVVVIGLVSIIMSVAIAWFENAHPVQESVHSFLVQTLDIPTYKSFLSARDHYSWYALQGVMERPWLGYGPRNLYYASLKFANNPIYTTYVSENTPLDFLSQHGILGGGIFLLIIITIVWRGRSALYDYLSLRHLLYIGFLTLLILMQGNSLQHYYMLFLLFFIIGACVYREKKYITIPIIIPVVLALIPFLVSTSIIVNKALSANGRYEAAVRVYPLSQNAYELLIARQAIQNEPITRIHPRMLQYERLFGGDPDALAFLGRIAFFYQNYEQSRMYYSQAHNRYPMNNNLDILSTTYLLTMKVEGKKEANQFLETHIDRFIQAKHARDNLYPMTEYYAGFITTLCSKGGIDCAYVFEN